MCTFTGILQNVVTITPDLPSEVIDDINTRTISLLSEILAIEVKSALQEVLLVLEDLVNVLIFSLVIFVIL